MAGDLARTAQYWSQRTADTAGKRPGTSWWEAGPEIQSYINRRISGDPELSWIHYTVAKHLGGRFASALVLGCGTGGLERTLADLVPFKRCDAYDIAQGSINKARAEAAGRGLHNIAYLVQDVNTIALPSAVYDVVWLAGALHHFEALEHICGEIRQSLKPDGLLVLLEYIGPNRFQFPERQKELVNLCLHLLPEKYCTLTGAAVTQRAQTLSGKTPTWMISKVIDNLKEGTLLAALRRYIGARISLIAGRPVQKAAVDFPTVRGIIAGDPSEAIRSQDIVPVVEQYFEIVERKDWGGNILQFLLAGIAGNFADGGAEGQALLRMLINIEETLMESGEFESDFAYIVARPIK